MYFWRSARVLACPCSLNFHPPLKVTTWLLHQGLLSWYLYNIDVSFGGNALRLEYSPVTSEHVVISPSCPMKSFYLLYRLTSFLTSLNSLSPSQWTHNIHSIVARIGFQVYPLQQPIFLKSQNTNLILCPPVQYPPRAQLIPLELCRNTLEWIPLSNYDGLPSI